MPMDISPETLLQITAVCALIVALLRLAAVFLTTAVNAKLRLRLACLALSVSLELGRIGAQERSADETADEKARPDSEELDGR